MSDLYQWLYDHYALPELEDLMEGQDGILAEYAARASLTKRQRRCLVDMAENMRLQWGTEAFTLGVRFGQALSAPRALDADCQWLLNFLPKLDDPVS